MHIVCRFCHNASQVDRYPLFPRATAAANFNWATAQKSIIANFEESNQHVHA